jgi:hypothetical protein
MVSPISVRAGNNASIDNETKDIKDAIMIINSNSDFCRIPMAAKVVF